MPRQQPRCAPVLQRWRLWGCDWNITEKSACNWRTHVIDDSQKQKSWHVGHWHHKKKSWNFHSQHLSMKIYSALQFYTTFFTDLEDIVGTVLDLKAIWSNTEYLNILYNAMRYCLRQGKKTPSFFDLRTKWWWRGLMRFKNARNVRHHLRRFILDCG